MTLTGVYGFWKYVSNLERRETRRYLEMFYALKLRSLVNWKLKSILYFTFFLFELEANKTDIFVSFLVMQYETVPLATDAIPNGV